MGLLRKVVAAQIQRRRMGVHRLRKGAVERQMIYLTQVVELSKVYWQVVGQHWSDLLKKAEGCCQPGLVG